MVFPGLNVPDDPLQNAVRRVQKWIPTWRQEAREKPFEDIRDFGDWIAKNDAVEPTAVVALSHHTDDRLSFQSGLLFGDSEAFGKRHRL